MSANLCTVKRSFNPFQNEHHSVKETREKGKTLARKFQLLEVRSGQPFFSPGFARNNSLSLIQIQELIFLNPITLISSMKIQVKQFWLSTNVNFIYWVHSSMKLGVVLIEFSSCGVKHLNQRGQCELGPLSCEFFCRVYSLELFIIIQLMWRTVSESTQSMWNTYSVGQFGLGLRVYLCHVSSLLAN